MGRGAIFAFTIATVFLVARNAKRMARATGVAMAEQDKIKQLFGRYVDPQIARDVMAQSERGARTIEATVLFTDLRDFTAMSERMEPEEVLEALNDHLRVILPVVHRHGGTVNKFIGDAIMATFGAPIRHDDHARRAVVAAQEMALEMETLNAARKRLERVPLKMGIGIATGPVVVGTLGTEDRVEYAVIGDTVNTASRLEGLCKEFGAAVVASSRTRVVVGDAQSWRALGEANVKGKAARVEVWTVASAG
jgi:adenylate cyclase